MGDWMNKAWRIDYNENRGQRKHGWLTPSEFAARASADLQSPAAPSAPRMPMVNQETWNTENQTLTVD
jgi:hypothetical protein